MRKISVPVKCTDLSFFGGREKVLEDLKKVGADRVFLAIDHIQCDEEKRKIQLEYLRENTEFFKANGLEVGSWMSGTWVRDNRFTAMKSADGSEFHSHACPMDEHFREYMTEYVMKIAQCGVDIIMFDDDYKFGFYNGGKSI